MAGPLVLAGEALGSTTARTAGRAGMQKLKDMLISLGIWEGIQAAADYAPDVLEKMYNSMTDSGVTPDQASSAKDGGRTVALIEAARQGVMLDEKAGLSKAEAKKYLAMLKQFGTALSASVDSKQVDRPASEDAAMANASYMLAMHRTCNRLGLTGPNRFRQLYDISLVINTIREGDVERAELHESLYGAIRT